jgi:hypothetical protein
MSRSNLHLVACFLILMEMAAVRFQSTMVVVASNPLLIALCEMGYETPDFQLSRSIGPDPEIGILDFQGRTEFNDGGGEKIEWGVELKGIGGPVQLPVHERYAHRLSFFCGGTCPVSDREDLRRCTLAG